MGLQEAIFSYFGVYIGVFGGLFMVMLIVDLLNVWDPFVRKLSIKAHDNIIDELHHEHKLVIDKRRKEKLEKMQKEEMKQGMHMSRDATINPEYSAPVEEQKAELEQDEEKDEDSSDGWRPHKGFRVSLLHKRKYYKLQIEDMPENFMITKFIARWKDARLVDMFYYILNNHTLFSMIGTDRCHPTSRNERRMEYLIHHSLALMFSCIIVNSGLDFGEAFVLNSFFCTPMIIILKLIFFQLTSCPMLENMHFDSVASQRIQEMLIRIGEHMGKILAAGSVYIFYLAATFSYSTQDFSNLGKYAYQIFIIAQFTEFTLIYLMFIRRYVQINLSFIPVMSFGGWYKSYALERGIDPSNDMELLRIIPGIISINYSRYVSDDYLLSLPVLKVSERKDIEQMELKVTAGRYAIVDEEKGSIDIDNKNDDNKNNKTNNDDNNSSSKDTNQETAPSLSNSTSTASKNPNANRPNAANRHSLRLPPISSDQSAINNPYTSSSNTGKIPDDGGR